ncbi:hypothetical protein H6P81_014437 [Aristolochia fimbriata]|uniref:Uncharacterized protein n=1 Tax=Aristolochia fimbriata TaxID=158543 RepID=A0AAV7EI76_ARIFI|nr:hypothetical protein H6P81_014437 [Aristolochia fimbriata]
MVKFQLETCVGVATVVASFATTFRCILFLVSYRYAPYLTRNSNESASRDSLPKRRRFSPSIVAMQRVIYLSVKDANESHSLPCLKELGGELGVVTDQVTDEGPFHCHVAFVFTWSVPDIPSVPFNPHLRMATEGSHDVEPLLLPRLSFSSSSDSRGPKLKEKLLSGV